MKCSSSRPRGDRFTLANEGTNTAIDANANQTTGLTAPITLAAGRINNTIDAGLISNTTSATSGISILKQPCISSVYTAGTAQTFEAAGTGADAAEDGTASISESNGSVTVALSSLINNATAAGQEVSGVIINFGCAIGTATLTNEAGNLINISNGTATPAAGVSITHWGVAQSGSTVTLATAGNGSVGGSPST